MYKNFFKYIFDFAFATFALIILSPVIVILTVVLYIANKGTPFFLHARPGKNEKLFKVIKFKTMNDKTDKHGELLPDEDRTTKIGGFIRKTSLDELPQLINIIKGDMSLIGPRPLIEEYLPLYTAEQARRHEIRPGLSGWAQVNGRNALSWPERFKLDVYYVDHCSLMLDIKILYRTFIKVFKREGIGGAVRFTGKE
jgi:undecaprenyl phosphate N,N'-diacetylbacillosamine 1-phosphate transferase